MLHRLVYCFAGLVLLLLGACQGYDVKVNDKIVYAPKPLLNDFSTPDPGLDSCLKETINRSTITAVEQLTALDCSFAGIESLEGLSAFSGLRILRLSGNNVRNLVEIGNIISLEAIFLDDNQVVDPVPLYQLPALREVDLSGNPALQCPKQGRFARVTALILPKHCP